MRKYLQLLSESPAYIKTKSNYTCQFIAWLFSIVAVSAVAGFIPFGLGRFYLPICGLCLLYILGGGIIKLKPLYVIMFLTFGISALLASEPFFNSRIRYIIFLVVGLISSPCIISKRALIFRSLISKYILIILSFMTIGSFLCYFLGINFVRNYIDNTMMDVTTVGGFGGLFVHSMMLGPLAALSALTFLNAYMANNHKIFIILFFASASTVLLSASRGSTLALIIPIAYSLLIMSNFKGSKKKLLGLLVFATILAIPVSEKLTSGLISKQQANIEAGGTFESRESKWSNRITEFKEHPVTGIGFSAVSINHEEDYTISGGIEPGSSHLAVLSMTGLLGFIPYIIVLISAFISIRKYNSSIARLRLCMLLAFIIHATFEGYVLAGGGFLCLMYWLTIGQCEDYKELIRYKLIVKPNITQRSQRNITQ